MDLMIAIMGGIMVSFVALIFWMLNHGSRR
jgi:hypothetical protein